MRTDKMMPLRMAMPLYEQTTRHFLVERSHSVDALHSFAAVLQIERKSLRITINKFELHTFLYAA